MEPQDKLSESILEILADRKWHTPRELAAKLEVRLDDCKNTLALLKKRQLVEEEYGEFHLIQGSSQLGKND